MAFKSPPVREDCLAPKLRKTSPASEMGKLWYLWKRLKEGQRLLLKLPPSNAVPAVFTHSGGVIMEILDSDQVGFIGVSQLLFASNGEKLCAALGEEFANPSTK